MRKDYLIVGIVIIAAVLIYSKLDRKHKDATADVGVEKIHIIDDKNMPIMSAGDQNKRPSIESTMKHSEPPVTPLNPAIAENFKNQLAKVLECVSPDKKSTLVKGIDPNFQNLVEFFNESYGQYVISLEDWVQSDVKMLDGTLKRVRIDTTYLDQSSPERRISVFGLDQKGNPQMETLDPEKSLNPTDDYVNGFFKDAEAALIEKSQRVYFPNGEELILIERNGRIESVTFTAEGKTSSCSGLDQETSNCYCN